MRPHIGRSLVPAVVRTVAAVMLLFASLGGAAAAVLPLQHGVGLHEWLNWAPLAPDGSYRWPPYRSVDAWLSGSRPLSDWPPGDPFRHIRDLGFDFVRLSVDPGPLLASSGDRRRQALDILSGDVRRLTDVGLKVVFNLQSVTEVPAYGPDVINAPADSPGVAGYEKMVADVATMLSAIGTDKVAIEPFNEPAHYPCGPGGDTDWQAIMASTVRAIRAVTPDLTIVATGACGGSVTGLVALNPSFDDPDIYYSFHMYEPHSFTHQRLDDAQAFGSGLPWPASAGSPDKVVARLRQRMTEAGIGPAAQAVYIGKVADAISHYFAKNWGPAQLDGRFAEAVDWARGHGIPPSRIFVGEFGVIRISDDGRSGAYDPDRLRYLTAVRTEAEHYGMPWSTWEYANPYGMSVIEPKGPAVPDMPMLAALGLKGSTGSLLNQEKP